MPVNSFENYPMTWKPVIEKNAKSLYHFLAERLEADIVSGSLLPGSSTCHRIGEKVYQGGSCASAHIPERVGIRSVLSITPLQKCRAPGRS